nr:hypothetical protein [Muribaculaceae bacterium]
MRITKLLRTLALCSILAAGAAEAENPFAPTGSETVIGKTQVLCNPSKLSDQNVLSGSQLGAADGWSMQCMNTSKQLQSGNAITVDGTQYNPIKLSNGAQNTITLPEGYVANAVTIYAVINADAATTRPCFWKEVDGTTYTSTVDHITSFKDFANPTVSYFKLSGDKNSFTITNSGEQPFVVLVVDYTDTTAPVDPDPVVPDVPAEYADWDIVGDGTTQFKPITEANQGQWSYNGTRYELKNEAEPHVAYVKDNTSASVKFYCAKAGVYSATFNVCSGSNPATVTYEIKNADGVVETSVTMPYNKETGDVVVDFPKQITVGPKTLTVSFAADHSSYICNFHAPSFTWIEEGEASTIPAGYLEIPGTLTLSTTYWTEGGLRIENAATDNPNFGYASNGASATAKVYCSEAGVYSAQFNFYAFYSEGDLKLTLTDEAAGTVETETVYHVASQGVAEITFPSAVTEGKKSLKVAFENVSGSFCANFYAPVFSKAEVGEGAVTEVTVDGVAAEAAVLEALNANGAAVVAD